MNRSEGVKLGEPPLKISLDPQQLLDVGLKVLNEKHLCTDKPISDGG